MNHHNTPASTGEIHKSQHNFWAHALAAIAVAMWGYSFVSTKVLLENGLGPTQIYICRFIIAYIVVLCISHKRIFCRSWLDECLILVRPAFRLAVLHRGKQRS